MQREKLLVSASPHIHEGSSTQGLMIHVLIALMPVVVASGMIFGARAWLVVAVCAVSCVVFEALFCMVVKQPIPVKDCSALVTGVILACNLPANIPLWTAVVGCFTAIVVVKQLFGGIGTNFANPALVGRLALFIGFASHMTNYAYPVKGGIDLVASATTDAVASATPLAAAEIPAGSTLGLFLGQYGGMLGETCSAMLILGGIYLILTGTISALIPVSYLGTVALLSFVTGHDVVVQLLSGGLLLGAFFMATDYVTSPFTRLGKLVFGIGLGCITCLIRFCSNMTEGVSFALLLMNLLVPYINELTRQKPLGGGKHK